MTYIYNPGFGSDEELIAGFVVRQPELQRILRTVQENTGHTYQHLLIVGPRGTGKTMLVRRVAAEVRRSPELSQNWYPLVFGEESYRILSAGEFWLEALDHLALQNPDTQWRSVYNELRDERDEQRLQQRALAQLMDFADGQGKQILLIVENLNMMFDEQMGKGDDWDLRHTLQNEPRLMLLGTATQRFDEIDNSDKAWFEFFALYTLGALTLSDCCTLWNAVDQENEHSPTELQMRPMQILTGGNPRLLIMLARFSQGKQFRDLMVNLTQLIDDHTDFFKNLLESLPATERRVFVELLEFWRPASTNEIAQAARLDTSKTSALLNRLSQKGAIVEVDQPNKKKYFQVAERLFNVYYLMRKRGGAESDIVKATVDFLCVFYSELPDRLKRAKSIAKEALDPSLSEAEREYLFKALGLMIDRLMEVNEGYESQQAVIKEICTDFSIAEKNKIKRALEVQSNNSAVPDQLESYVEKHTEVLTLLVIEMAANGQAKEALNYLDHLPDSAAKKVTMTGLELFLGRDRPLVAQEIYEAGKDIADRIRAKQQEIEASKMPKLTTIQFASVRLDEFGEIVDRPKGSAEIFQEDLGNGVSLNMVKIIAGSFTMGQSLAEKAELIKSYDQETYQKYFSDEGPQHLVQVPEFYLGQNLVTQEQWQAIMGNNPAHFKGDHRLPVENVSWLDAVDFCENLTKRSQEAGGGYSYRLPTEAEWEYACRAGTQTPFAFGATITPEVVNYNGNYPYGQAAEGVDRSKTTTVGSFPLNSFGLYDMHGNLWEWCLDEYFNSYDHVPMDGSAQGDINSRDPDKRRPLRGGSWFNYGDSCRSAYRIPVAAGYRHYHVGLRVVAVASSTPSRQNS